MLKVYPKVNRQAAQGRRGAVWAVWWDRKKTRQVSRDFFPSVCCSSPSVQRTPPRNRRVLPRRLNDNKRDMSIPKVPPGFLERNVAIPGKFYVNKKDADLLGPKSE